MNLARHVRRIRTTARAGRRGPGRRLPSSMVAALQDPPAQLSGCGPSPSARSSPFRLRLPLGAGAPERLVEPGPRALPRCLRTATAPRGMPRSIVRLPTPLAVHRRSTAALAPAQTQPTVVDATRYAASPARIASGCAVTLSQSWTTCNRWPTQCRFSDSTGESSQRSHHLLSFAATSPVVSVHKYGTPVLTFASGSGPMCFSAVCVDEPRVDVGCGYSAGMKRLLLTGMSGTG